MKKYLLYCSLFALVLSACNAGAGKKKETATTPATTPVTTNTTNLPVVNGSGAGALKAAPAGQAGATTAAAGLNPAHGQPGHRCDVAVGAPLNGAAAPSVTIPGNQPQNNNITVNPAPSAPIMPMPATNTGGGSGRLNPAHGQPGHRCDVQVGQPLPK